MAAPFPESILAAIRAEHAAFIANPPAQPSGMGDLAKATGVLPAIFDWTAFAGITFAGEVVWVDYDPPHTTEAAAPAYVRNSILHRLAVKYTTLAVLSPERPQDAIECRGCGGTGTPIRVGNVQAGTNCWCGGLGWLPAGTELPFFPREGWWRRFTRRLTKAFA